jgi:hypothetical protein
MAGPQVPLRNAEKFGGFRGARDQAFEFSGLQRDAHARIFASNIAEVSRRGFSLRGFAAMLQFLRKPIEGFCCGPLD